MHARACAYALDYHFSAFILGIPCLVTVGYDDVVVVNVGQSVVGICVKFLQKFKKISEPVWAIICVSGLVALVIYVSGSVNAGSVMIPVRV